MKKEREGESPPDFRSALSMETRVNNVRIELVPRRGPLF